MFVKKVCFFVLFLTVAVSQLIEPPAYPPVFTLSNGKDIPWELTATELDVVIIVCSVRGGIPFVSQTTISCDRPVVDFNTLLRSSSNRGQNVVMKILIINDMNGCSCTCSAKHISGKYSRTSKIVFNVQRRQERTTALMKSTATIVEQSNIISTTENHLSLEASTLLYTQKLRSVEAMKRPTKLVTAEYTTDNFRQVLTPRERHLVVREDSKNSSIWDPLPPDISKSTNIDQTANGPKNSIGPDVAFKTVTESVIINPATNDTNYTSSHGEQEQEIVGYEKKRPTMNDTSNNSTDHDVWSRVANESTTIDQTTKDTTNEFIHGKPESNKSGMINQMVKQRHGQWKQDEIESAVSYQNMNDTSNNPSDGRSHTRVSEKAMNSLHLEETSNNYTMYKRSTLVSTESSPIAPRNPLEVQCLCASDVGLYYLIVYFTTVLTMIAGFACYLKKVKRKICKRRRESDEILTGQVSALSYMNIAQEPLMGVDLEYCNVMRHSFWEPLDSEYPGDATFHNTFLTFGRKSSLDPDDTEYITPIDNWSDDLCPNMSYSEPQYSEIL